VAVQPDPLEAAEANLGTAGLQSLRVSMTGARFTLGQQLRTSDTAPVRTVKSSEANIDYVSGSMRIESVMTTSSTAGAFVGDQHSVEAVSGEFAWSEQSPPAGEAADPNKPTAQAQPDSASDRLLWLWTLAPQGVLKAASHATVHGVPGGTELTFTLAGHHMTAFVNQMNQVERVETLMPDVLFGDVAVVVKYTGYKDFGGIQFPSLITRSEGGKMTAYLAVTEVEKNPPMSIMVPDNVRHYDLAKYYVPLPNGPALSVKTQKIADGVYWFTGLIHHSMAVDMGDYIVMVEAPLNELRSEAVIAETRKLIPGKPIRYVVNTHVHSDHSGGLRTYVDEGATVVTQEANRAYYEKAWAGPRTLEPDRLSRSGKHAKFMAVKDSGELKGSNGRRLEVHLLQGNPHNEENLVVWLPAERILFQSDMLNGASRGNPTPVTRNFYDNLQRLGIAPLQIVGGHGGRVLTGADLDAAVGKN